MSVGSCWIDPVTHCTRNGSISGYNTAMGSCETGRHCGCYVQYSNGKLWDWATLRMLCTIQQWEVVRLGDIADVMYNTAMGSCETGRHCGCYVQYSNGKLWDWATLRMLCIIQQWEVVRLGNIADVMYNTAMGSCETGLHCGCYVQYSNGKLWDWATLRMLCIIQQWEVVRLGDIADVMYNTAMGSCETGRHCGCYV